MSGINTRGDFVEEYSMTHTQKECFSLKLQMYRKGAEFNKLVKKLKLRNICLSRVDCG